MAFSFKKFLQGIKIIPKSGSIATDAGDIEYDSSQDKLTVRNSSSVSPVVTESHASQGANRVKNKDLEDSTTAIVDNSDTTKKIKFDAAGTTGTSTTIQGSQTADRTITLPDRSDTLVTLAGAESLTNKTLLTVDNLQLDVNTISSTNTNGDINLTANGTGKVKVEQGAGKGIDVQAAGALEVGASVGANNLTLGGSSSTVVVAGNLQVNGTTTTVNSSTLNVADTNITVNNGGNDASSEGAGLTIGRTGTAGSFIYKNASATKFAAGAAGSEVDLVGISSSQTLTNKTLTAPVVDIQVWDDQASTPANPSSGFYKSYFKTDGKLYKLDSTGLEAEVGGSSTITVTAGETLAVGDAVYISVGASDGSRTSGRAYKLDATNDYRVEYLGLCSSAGNAGNTVIVQVAGELSGLSGLTVGEPAYASISTPGSFQATAPTGSGQWVIQLGIAKSTTVIVVNGAGSATAAKITAAGTGGSGSGSGGINYITNSSAETDTSGWATYADAAGSSPVDGTGGSPTLTFTRSTSSPLRGSASFLVTKDAANRQGNGASYDFTIDSADKAKILQVTADYAIASGTYADGDLTVYIYDVTNSLVIQPAGYVINKLTQDLPGKLNATFQTASNSTSYRLIIHCASTSASAYTVKLDNVSVGPQVVEYGAPVTDWVAYTPTFGAGFGTTTNVDVKYRRVGDSVQIYGIFQAGTVTTGPASISLPAGYSIAPTQHANDTSNLSQKVGWYGNNGTVASSVLTATTTDATKIYLGRNTTVNAILPIDNVNTYFANSAYISFDAVIPIAGWSSSVVMSNDTDTRVVSFLGVKSGTQAVTANTTNITFVASKDSHGKWDGSIYTVPVPGDYQVSAILWNNTTAAGYFEVYKNATLVRRIITSPATADTGSGSTLLPNLVAGDTISIRSNTSITVADGGSLTINRLSGPSAIAQSETVAIKYSNEAGTSITSSAATLPFATKLYDTHGAFNGSSGVFTAPVAGKYSMSVNLYTAAVNNSTSQSLIGFTLATATPEGKSASQEVVAVLYGNGVSHGQYISFNRDFSLISGDTLAFQVQNSNTTTADNGGRCVISIHRIGN